MLWVIASKSIYCCLVMWKKMRCYRIDWGLRRWTGKRGCSVWFDGHEDRCCIE